CCSAFYLVFSFFFFQAEDGIRDLYVTGVQTCALPILDLDNARAAQIHHSLMPLVDALFVTSSPIPLKYALNRIGMSVGNPRLPRSEERRVGKECRSRWSPEQ